MTVPIKEKINLGSVTHSVRAAQAVMQYGVGAMVDFPDQTLMTAQPEYWSKTQKIYDERFAKALGVRYFAMPTDVAYARFPEWYFCPKCRKFQPLDKWVEEYVKKANSGDGDKYMVWHMQCQTCRQDLVVARVVTVCEQGHINDFPWVQWVHVKNIYGPKDVCANPSLVFKTGASATEGLEGLTIECSSCKARANLKGAFWSGKSEENPFKKLDKDLAEPAFRCPGNHPQKHTGEKCTLYPRTVQRGSSSVYFPVVYSSIVIPPYADMLNKKIEGSNAFDNYDITLNNVPEGMRTALLTTSFGEWSNNIALEIGLPVTDVRQVLQRKWMDEPIKEIDILSVKYRAEEYQALNGEVTAPASEAGDFSREEMEIAEYRLPHVKSIVLIDKVRVVNALIGFSRINPVISRDDEGFVHVKEPGTPWYPAYEVKGEGIFIEFAQSDIDKWIADHPITIERAKLLHNNYAISFIAKNHPRTITPKFVLLHTLAHLLIKQLSFECGYSIASLSERLYCSEESDGKQMAGIFIYTAGGDSEGTLGGLVRQGRPDALPRIFRKAVSDARICSNDPVCILSRGQGRDALNLAACHACALLPETCCEERNGFLDRGLITGTYDNPDIGFFCEIS